MLYYKKWEIEYYSDKVQDWIDELPTGIQASFARLTELLIEFGIDLHLPHAKSMGSGLFELRPKGKEGIARLFYCAVVSRKIIFLHGFIKKTQKTPKKELKIAVRRMNEVKNEYKNKAHASI